MRPIERNEVLPIGEYEAIRPHFRARVIEEKRPRRVKVGEHMSVVFENRDTVLYQIQEMLRTERITNEPAVLHEIETYNDLIPADGELSLTLFVEIPDKPLRDRMLVELAGLEQAVGIEVDGVVHPAIEKLPPGFVEGRTTAVHYMKVPLPAAAAAAIRSGKARVAIVVTHPKHPARAELGPAAIAKLGEDLAPVAGRA